MEDNLFSAVCELLLFVSVVVTDSCGLHVLPNVCGVVAVKRGACESVCRF